MYQEFYKFLLELNYAMAEMFEKTKIVSTTEEEIHEQIIDFCSAYGILYKAEILENRGKEYRIFDIQF